MKSQCISIELRAIVAGTAPKVQGAPTWSRRTAGQLTGHPPPPGGRHLGGRQPACRGWWLVAQGPHLSAKSSLYLCGRVPERSESGTRVGGKKQTSDSCAGVVHVGNSKTSGWGENQELPWPGETRLAKLPLRHSAAPPRLRHWPSCLNRPH